MAKSKSDSTVTNNKQLLEFLKHYQPEEVEKRAKQDAEVKRICNILIESGLFDARWYRKRYPDIAQANLDPVYHYVNFGATERRDPSPHFSTTHYFDTHPEVEKANQNPLYHFIVEGSYREDENFQSITSALRDRQKVIQVIAESGLFDPDYYLTNHADVASGALDAIEHYVAYGASELRRAGPKFDTKFYVEAYEDVAAIGINPLYHFIRFGRDEGRLAVSPLEFGSEEAHTPDQVVRLIKNSGFMNPDWYLAQNPDVERAGIDPVEHFVKYGNREGRYPSPDFMPQFYKTQMSDEEQAVFNALEHYILLGHKKGLLTSPRQMELAKPLPSGPAQRPLPASGSIAVMAHIFYEDMTEEFARYLGRIPYLFDLLISTSSEAKKAVIEEGLYKLSNLGTLDVRVVPNRGRDIAPMVITFARECLAHDFVLHVHSKRSPYGDETFGWFEHCMDHLLDSPLYIDSIFARFAADPSLGIQFPPPFPGIARHMHWAEMKPAAIETLERIGLPPSLVEEFPLEFPAGSMMWFRSAALRPIFEAQLKIEDFPEEEGQANDTLAHTIERLSFYVAHHQGFSREAIRPAAGGEYFLPRPTPIPAEPMQIPVTDSPLVSIVVPVYNQWEHTAACLASIVTFTDAAETPYEIVLADDGSTDETINTAQYFPGVKVSRTPSNRGFLENCNFAFQRCRGRYIVFLNNDTQVQPHWLKYLVKTFVERPDAAVVGSKLIYPNGRLQEAGGIIWNNAGGLNYGRNENPAEARFCYLKETDYVSGAALMVDVAFFRACGGFDRLYSPAYYEDTDICFQARAAGRKVYMQPASLVVHLEGTSHGTDESTGVKRHQVVNRNRFKEKWADVLAKQHYTGAELIRARDRSVGQTVICVIDHLLPEFDRHAGARYTMSYMRLLLEHGYRLKYLACKLESERQLKFARHLEQLGIETHHPVVIGPVLDWRKWIEENAAGIDGFWLHRPHTATAHMAACLKTGKPIIYFCHDLHRLRERREAELEGDLKKAASIAMRENDEIDVFRASHVAYTPSSFEADYLRQQYGLENVIVNPVHLIDTPPKRRKGCPPAQDLLFVGGMHHLPNRDGILWFLKEVWPQIRAKQPKARVHIVGTGATAAIADLASSDVVVHGGVDEARLVELYQSVRAAILPLRYGAGVKGKLIEAFQHGVPVVSTAVGLEGVAGVQRFVQATDLPSDFAMAALNLLNAGDEQWLDAAHRLASFGYANFSKDRGWRAWQEGLQRVGLSRQENWRSTARIRQRA